MRTCKIISYKKRVDCVDGKRVYSHIDVYTEPFKNLIHGHIDNFILYKEINHEYIDIIDIHPKVAIIDKYGNKYVSKIALRSIHRMPLIVKRRSKISEFKRAMERIINDF